MATFFRAFVEKRGINEKRQTPAHTKQDGVDYVPMSTKKVYLVQLLNIAGVGQSLVWVFYGRQQCYGSLSAVFAGAVHDYFSGMLSVRYGGASVPTITGRYLGNGAKLFLNIFAIVLLLLVGVVFVSAPAGMITNLINDQTSLNVSMTTMVVAIFAYYIIATIVPVDNIIGRFYPLFGALLIFMSVGLMTAVAFSSEHTVMGDFRLATC